jgi:hypothetical protein
MSGDRYRDFCRDRNTVPVYRYTGCPNLVLVSSDLCGQKLICRYPRGISGSHPIQLILNISSLLQLVRSCHLGQLQLVLEALDLGLEGRYPFLIIGIPVYRGLICLSRDLVYRYTKIGFILGLATKVFQLFVYRYTRVTLVGIPVYTGTNLHFVRLGATLQSVGNSAFFYQG